MITREIKPGILSVGTIDWDRRLFDELVHLPEGTSYNAYLVQGSEKTALIGNGENSPDHCNGMTESSYRSLCERNRLPRTPGKVKDGRRRKKGKKEGCRRPNGVCK